VAGFFAKSLQKIQDGLDKAYEASGYQAKVRGLIGSPRELAAEAGQPVQKVILVGGLASSPYVYQKLVAWGRLRGVAVSRPDGPTWVSLRVSSSWASLTYGMSVPRLSQTAPLPGR
jgi:hypothetical protein